MTRTPKTKRSRAQWKQIVEGKERSELSVENYCKEHHIAPSNCYAWRTKFAKEEPASLPSPDQQSDWQAITLNDALLSPASSWDIELSLPGGVCLKMKTV